MSTCASIAPRGPAPEERIADRRVVAGPIVPARFVGQQPYARRCWHAT
jgi:hypothetical protein